MSERRHDLVAGVAIAGAALWAALWRIGTTTILVDEPIYTSVGRRYLSGDLSQNLEHPPVAKYAFGLAQLVFGDGIESARVVSALASVVIALVVWRLGSMMFGPGTGIIAAVLWVALPRSIGSSEVGTPGDRLERFAYLEPLTAMFMVLALWFGWRVWRGNSWIDVVGLGMSIGLATGTKISGVAIAIPIGVALLIMGRWRMVVPLASAAVISVVTFLGTYAPFGRTANEAWLFMYRFQREQGELGHTIFVRGSARQYPPWYTELWYHLDADGLWLSAATVALVVLAFVEPERRRRVAYTFGAVVGVYLFLSLLPVQVRHYRFVIWPPLVLVMAAGITTIARPIRRGWRILGGAGLAIVVAVGAMSLGRLAVIAPQDYAALGSELVARDVGPDARIVIFGPLLAARAHLQAWNPEQATDPVGPEDADVVLVDSTYTVRFGEPTVSGVSVAFEMGRVRVLLLE